LQGPRHLGSSLQRYGALVVLVCAFTAALALEFLAPERHTAIFLASILAIIPLAGYIGRATDNLAAHLGGAIGGLLNATFGNIAELIIGAFALRAGFIDLVKATFLLCQVKAPQNRAAMSDWYAQEGVHRRMIGRETD